MDTLSLKHDASSAIYESTYTKIFTFIWSLIVNDLGFPLLSIFNPLAAKFVLIDDQILSL
jgi:hypothetical protein